jgi:hypothetical protein
MAFSYDQMHLVRIVEGEGEGVEHSAVRDDPT